MGKHKKKTHTETQHKYNLNFRCPKYLPPKINVCFFSCLVFHSLFFLVVSLTKPGCYVESALKSTGRSRTSETKFQISGFSVIWSAFLVKQRVKLREDKKQNEQKQIKNKKNKDGNKQWSTTTKKKKDKTSKVRKQRWMTNLQRRKDVENMGQNANKTASHDNYKRKHCFSLFSARHSISNFSKRSGEKTLAWEIWSLTREHKNPRTLFFRCFFSCRKIPRVNKRTGGGHFYRPSPTFLDPLLWGSSFGCYVHSSEITLEKSWFRQFWGSAKSMKMWQFQKLISGLVKS